MIYQFKDKNSVIIADQITIGENFQIGNDVNINVRGSFSIGDNSTIGDRFFARGENIYIGDYFFNVPTDNRGMIIGGGSSGFPFANLHIGDRCVCHTGHINLAKEVYIGNDVGLSHDVDIITHGFWGSVLEGHPRKFGPVFIQNNVIIGWKSVIMPNVTIANNNVIGAHSTVIKNTNENTIYAGSPAKEISRIKPIPIENQIEILKEILKDFNELLSFYDTGAYSVKINYPYIEINNLKIDIILFTCSGEHDEITDAFRDHIRRYGIRIFHPRGFKFNLKRKS